MMPNVGIIGSGPAALITAHTLIKDGFSNVRLITRDRCVGGTWAKFRVYPGLSLNNVHGELRFSAMEMKLPPESSKTGGRLTGEVMSDYMESYASKFLCDRIQHSTEVLNIRRGENSSGWVVKARDLTTNTISDFQYSKLVLCTGGCSSPYLPPALSPQAAEASGFQGLVFHSSYFNQHLPHVLQSTQSIESGSSDRDHGSVVIIGCGKSAQDMATYLANQGRKVSVIFERLEPYLASVRPRPAFLRKSRVFSTLSPYSTLSTGFERFLHSTWLGSKFARLVIETIGQGGFNTYNISKDSPLRNVEPGFFWHPRPNDSGVAHSKTFYGLATSGKIDLYSPTQAVGYDPGHVLLQDGRKIAADVVIVATGYKSSWDGLFDDQTAEELGIRRRILCPSVLSNNSEWESYYTLQNPPTTSTNHLENSKPSKVIASSIYRGIVPAKNINKRDFAINGAILAGNAGYAFEVASHWISSYFLGDKLRLPATPEAALAEAERHSVWCEKRFPGALKKLNESIAAAVHIWSWPQATDELLEDMHLPSYRSGGNWYNWMLKVIDMKEIANLTEERKALREAGRL